MGLSAAALLGSSRGFSSVKPSNGKGWKSVLILDNERKRVSGSEQELAIAIRRGADLRIYTEFRYNEHVDTKSENREIVQEVSEFHVTYLVEDRWAAGIMTQRQPIEPPTGFGPRPSMSFFLYNQNGQQAISRPYLDGLPAIGMLGAAPVADHSAMPKYHQQDSWDAGTNAPSQNFIYDFERFQYWVRDEWREVFSHTADGTPVSGSLAALTDEFAQGAEVKIAVRGLCADLSEDPEQAVDHEVFAQCGWCYYHTGQKLFASGVHPLVRVAPAVPLRYRSKNWDFGWLMARTDGFVARWLVDPYTLKFSKSHAQYALRWFVR